MLNEEIWTELERFNIVKDVKSDVPGFLDNPSLGIELAGTKLSTENLTAIASIMLRNAAFIYVAQLYMITKYRTKWEGDRKEVGLVDGQFKERWNPKWTFQYGQWVSLENEEHVFLALKDLICDCRTLIKDVAEKTKTPKLVLWENVWGYVLWMYVQLFSEQTEISERAREDLALLLKKEMWDGFERQSPFKKFLGRLSPEESMANYSRVTCCLFYMIPGNDQCSYCPKKSKKECLQ